MIFNEKIIKALDSSTSLHSVPFTIADDMVNMLDSTDFFKEPDLTITASEYINNHRVIDVSCKSGSLLFSFYKKFMIALRNVFPDRDDRDYFIVRNLLFGLCPSARYLSMLRATFYSNKKYDLSNELGNFYHYDFKNQIGVDNKEVKELLKNMKFDVVCGNPPYNGSLYIDFCNSANKLSSHYSIMLVPSHWRLKFSNSANEMKKCLITDKHLKEFHMFECNPDGCTSVFGKRNEGGVQAGSVCYYLCDLLKAYTTVDVYEQRYINNSLFKWNSEVNIIHTRRQTIDERLDVFVVNAFTLSILNKVLNSPKFKSISSILMNSDSDSDIYVTNCLSACSRGKHTTLAGFFISGLTDIEIANMNNYFSTKFWRMLNRSLNSGYASCEKYMYRFLPAFDFTQVIDDAYIASYFGFTQEEITYISNLTCDNH